MQKPIKSLCIFCGSNPGTQKIYQEHARQMGTLLAQKKIRLIYGGGRHGLMGVVADACMAAGGEVVGIIPQSLVDKEWAHRGLTQLEIVQTMHQRKARMMELSDAFVALPGGYGTLDELFEIITWSQLGFHAKPIGLLNSAGYYDGLLEFIGRAIEEEFIPQGMIVLFVERNEPGLLLKDLLDYQPQHHKKWINREKDL